jgi:ribosome-binding protein aMBF1 (putative translation factor)
MYDNQDWNVVILRKSEKNTSIEQKSKQTPVATSTTIANKPAWKIEQQIDSDVGKPLQYVSREDAHKIIQGRVQKKLSQKDLATRLNMQVKDIADIETCKAIENKLILSKIKKFLTIQ